MCVCIPLYIHIFIVFVTFHIRNNVFWLEICSLMLTCQDGSSRTAQKGQRANRSKNQAFCLTCFVETWQYGCPELGTANNFLRIYNFSVDSYKVLRITFVVEHDIILLSYHHITSYHHIIISSYQHIIISSYHHIIISSYHHIIISSKHHITISSYQHIVISSYHQNIISS